MVAPCVEVLQQLAQDFKNMLGADIGTAHHPMNLSVDIPDLMANLDDHEVYSYKKGRYLNEDDNIVQDIITTGFNDLITGISSPLNKYNKAFAQLQSRHCMLPLVGSEPTTVLQSMTSTPEPVVTTTLVTASTLEPNESENNESSEEGEEEEEDILEYMQAFKDGGEPILSLESMADVLLDMDEEDLGGEPIFMFENMDEDTSDSEVDSDHDNEDEI